MSPRSISLSFNGRTYNTPLRALSDGAITHFLYILLPFFRKELDLR
jgi:hypothetical protein